jgi:hypothetical protein
VHPNQKGWPHYLEGVSQEKEECPWHGRFCINEKNVGSIGFTL